jgi:hypothetical protein
MLQTLVADWRDKFAQPDIVFGACLLAAWQSTTDRTSFPLLRLAQVNLTGPASPLASRGEAFTVSTIDMGDPSNGAVHSPYKQAVGHRAGNGILSLGLGLTTNTPYLSPRYAGASVQRVETVQPVETVGDAAETTATSPAPPVDVSTSEWLANAPPLPSPPSGHGHDAAGAEVEWGATLFLHGKVTASVNAFGAAMVDDGSVNGTLWQRGCALFYTEQLNASAAQFALDVAGNPHDTEEAVWRWLAQARALGPVAGPPHATAHILNTTGESRPYMVKVYTLYKTGTAAAAQDVLSLCASSDAQSAFYANMYFGLYAEQHGNTTAARAHLHRAGLSSYGPASDDYMWWLTRVHNAVRGWPIADSTTAGTTAGTGANTVGTLRVLATSSKPIPAITTKDSHIGTDSTSGTVTTSGVMDTTATTTTTTITKSVSSSSVSLSVDISFGAEGLYGKPLQIDAKASCPPAIAAASCESFAVLVSRPAGCTWEPASASIVGQGMTTLRLTILSPSTRSISEKGSDTGSEVGSERVDPATAVAAVASTTIVATRGYFANWPIVSVRSGDGLPLDPWMAYVDGVTDSPCPLPNTTAATAAAGVTAAVTTVASN